MVPAARYNGKRRENHKSREEANHASPIVVASSALSQTGGFQTLAKYLSIQAGNVRGDLTEALDHLLLPQIEGLI
jgi:hypothetical protein